MPKIGLVTNVKNVPGSVQMPAGWFKASVRVFPLVRRQEKISIWSLLCHRCSFSHSLPVPHLTSPSPYSSCSSFSKCCTYLASLSSFSSKYPPNFQFGRAFCTCAFHRIPCFSLSAFFSKSTQSSVVMNLSEVLKVLEQLAPLSLAEPWDNVGLLVEPSKPQPVRTILLTNDLTMDVMEEAEHLSCDLIISYHPPLFRPIKRLVQKDWKQQLAIRAIEAGIAVYSPHTALDSVKGGVNDWLIGGVGSGYVSVLHQALSSAPSCHKLEFTVNSRAELDSALAELRDKGTGQSVKFSATRQDSDMYHVSMSCPDSDLPSVVQMLSKHPVPCQSLSILEICKPPLPGYGQGRLSALDESISVATAVDRVKAHLGLSHVRLALGAQQSLESLVNTVAVCAGSGSSVLQGVKANLYITGEMSHHEVLDAVALGTSVILCDHSNTERGYLHVLKERLSALLSQSVSVQLSQRDRDPLIVV